MANWKMHGSLAMATNYIDELAQYDLPQQIELVLLPPVIYFNCFLPRQKKNQFSLGAQNVASAGQGAFTGEVSAAMLKEFDCKYVLICFHF